MNRILMSLITGCCLVAFGHVSFADISLPKIFSDNMVLQRGTDINIWGSADADEELEITLGDHKVSVTADAEGRWSTKLPATEHGGPHELVISGKEARVVFKNVMIGELWICSGQSNMQWPLIQSVPFKDDEEMEKFISGITDSKLRLFTVPRAAVDKPANDISEASVWQECAPDTIREFSGLAYFFAKHLRNSEKLADMPIGLIDSSWGGTPCESWTSREALEADGNFEGLLKHWDAKAGDRGPQRPASLFNGMIAPLIPMTVRGAIWYQGESNVGRGSQYAKLFPAMIVDWRKQFGQGDIPFYFVQLAPHRYSNNDPQALPEVWDAQLKTLVVPNTGMVPSIDIGNLTDIHPKNKNELGRRLSMLARSMTYGEDELAYCGPVYSKMEPADGRKLGIDFDFADGLACPDGELKGFLICGEDKNFVEANAEIVDGKVLVWSDKIDDPVHVRYLWDDSATANLFNRAGLPASPFRTDDFDLLSKDREF